MKLRALLVLLALSACEGVNDNNGLDHQLFFVLSQPPAVDEIARVYVSRGDNAHCADVGLRSSAEVCAPEFDVDSILDASCGPDCDVIATGSEASEAFVEVVVHGTAPAQLAVHAHLGDGSDRRDRFALPAAVPAAGLAGACVADGGSCGTRYAVFVGARFNLRFWAVGADGTALDTSDLDVTLDGDALTMTDAVAWWPDAQAEGGDAWLRWAAHLDGHTERTLTAVHGGTAWLHVHGGSVDRMVRVDVADPATVVAGEVYVYAGAGTQDIDAEILDGPAPSRLHMPHPIGEPWQFALVWTLADGRRALGGYDRARVSANAGIAADEDDGLDGEFDPRLVGLFDFTSFATGEVEVTADLGAAHLRWAPYFAPAGVASEPRRSDGSRD